MSITLLWLALPRSHSAVVPGRPDGVAIATYSGYTPTVGKHDFGPVVRNARALSRLVRSLNAYQPYSRQGVYVCPTNNFGLHDLARFTYRARGPWIVDIDLSPCPAKEPGTNVLISATGNRHLIEEIDALPLVSH